MCDEAGTDVAGDLSDLFGDIEAEDVASFLLVPKTDCLILSAELSVFEVIS